MRGILSLSLMFLSALSTSASADLCDVKREELKLQGITVISCEKVDFEKKAISSDYQSKQTEPVAVYPSAVREDLGQGKKGKYLYVNEAPGIKNSKYFNPITSSNAPEGAAPQQGFSLLSKFTTSLSTQFPEDQELLKWMNDPNGILKEVMPNSGASAMVGRCEAWSAWSLDPEIRKVLGRMSHGVLCGELIPYTRGELKELITLLYPAPELSSRKYLGSIFTNSGFYTPHEVEDANLALSKLGELAGGSEFTPDQVLLMASEAKKKGQNLILDIDPGREIWNQPVESVVDLTFIDPLHPSSAKFLSSDFKSRGSEGDAFLADLNSAESELKSMALLGKNYVPLSLCKAREDLGLSCDTAPSRLSEKVNYLDVLKKTASDRGFIESAPTGMIRHQLFIQYGVESAFAVSEDLPSKTRVLEYSEVGARKVWSPAVRRLSEVCGSQGFMREDHNSALAGLDLNEDCQKFKTKEISDREVMTGALPPKKIECYTATPQFGSDKDSQMKKKAYAHLMEMMKSCDVYDSGVAFLGHLNVALSKNSLNADDIKQLAAEYQGVSKLLDEKFVREEIQSTLGNAGDPQAHVDGLSRLYEALFKH
jgi:hypothetical protein